MFNEKNNTYLNEEPEYLSFLLFFKHSLCHQAMFYKRDLFNENRFGLYRENYRIVSDWEFNIRSIIFGGCSIEHIPLPIVFIEFAGISLTNRRLSLEEREIVFLELVPHRILYDYEQMKLLEEELIQIKTSKAFRIISKAKKILNQISFINILKRKIT
jgi:hypothetical protein